MNYRRNAKALAQIELGELRSIEDLQKDLAHIFPSRGSLDWELRTNRREYLKARALFEISGRLMAHPGTFKRVALEIASRRVSVR